MSLPHRDSNIAGSENAPRLRTASGNGRQSHGMEDMLTGSGGPVVDWMILRQMKKMYTGVIAMLMKLQVIGLDISPHMIPEELPDNLDLQVDDLNGK